MKIVIINNRLRRRSGTEIVTRDMARVLSERGHDVCVYAEKLGPIADEVRADGAHVVSDALDIPFVPDVIHTNTVDAAPPVFLRFPLTPAFGLNHGQLTPFGKATYANVVARGAVSIPCAQRVAEVYGGSPDDVPILHNAVDIDRLPDARRRADKAERWLFVAVKKRSRNVLAFLQREAKRQGVQFDAVGSRARHVVDDLSVHALDYDLVFASGRSALESAATGVPVIVTAPQGIGGMLTRERWKEWRDLNLGRELCTNPITGEQLSLELAKRAPDDAFVLAGDIRAQNSLDELVTKFEDVYTQIAGSRIDGLDRANELQMYQRIDTGRLAWVRAKLRKYRLKLMG